MRLTRSAFYRYCKISARVMAWCRDLMYDNQVLYGNGRADEFRTRQRVWRMIRAVPGSGRDE